MSQFTTNELIGTGIGFVTGVIGSIGWYNLTFKLSPKNSDQVMAAVFVSTSIIALSTLTFGSLGSYFDLSRRR